MHPLIHTEYAPREGPRVSSNGDAVGRYRRMALAVVRRDGCLRFESLREEWRVCGSGTRRKKPLTSKHGSKAADDIKMAQLAKTNGRKATVLVKAASLRPMRGYHPDSITSGSVREFAPSSCCDLKTNTSLRSVTPPS